jgi:hypothetical protein
MQRESIQRYLYPSSQVMIVASKKVAGILDKEMDFSRDSRVALVVVNLSLIVLGPEQCESAR